jgi:hypothetical protein
MRKSIFILITLSAYLSVGFYSPKFTLPKIKTLRVWKAWADTMKYPEHKWLVTQNEFYPNGEQKRKFSLEYQTKDTLGLMRFVLGKDSTLYKVFSYNKYTKKWQQTAQYFYHPGQKHPYLANTQFGYKTRYSYDAQGREISSQLINDHNEIFHEYVTSYDASGLVTQESEFRYFNGHRDDESRKIYEYVKDAQGRVLQKEAFYVPATGPEPTIEVNKQGTQKITYHGSATMEKKRIETVYYNQKGELIKTVEYDLDGKPQFIWTYEYEYYR